MTPYLPNFSSIKVSSLLMYKIAEHLLRTCINPGSISQITNALATSTEVPGYEAAELYFLPPFFEKITSMLNFVPGNLTSSFTDNDRNRDGIYRWRERLG